MGHRIDIEELREWMTDQKVLYASSSKEQKRLFATLRGSFEVYHKGEKVMETMQPSVAVNKYNGI